MFYFQILTLIGVVGMVSGHARLIDPPSRSSMWRFGFNSPPNYNDNELFCGGLTVQHSWNKGHCGVCGDAYHLPQPRPNEAGGLYGKGIIVKTYRKGQIFNAVIDVTANHLGYFEFKICPNNNPKKIVSQDCLDKYPLSLSNNSSTRFYVKAAFLGKASVSLKLPEDMICTQCVLQWQYKGENNWGVCKDGHGALGCGPQETFRACADVEIIGNDDVKTANDEFQRSRENTFTNFSKRTTFPFALTGKISTVKPSSNVFTHSKVSTTSHISSTLSFSSTKFPLDSSKASVEHLKTRLPIKITTKLPILKSTASPSTVSIKTTKIVASSPTISTVRSTTGSQTNNELNIRSCRGVLKMRNAIPGLDYWCQTNCAMGYCPPNLCFC